MMTLGTCYFPSFQDAMTYYRPYLVGRSHEECRAWVKNKLKEGEIHIGKPTVKPGQTLFVKENRYHIQEL